MPNGVESDETARTLARELERDRVQCERAMTEFRASLPVSPPSADAVETLVVLYEQWFKQLDNAARTAHLLSTKHKCSVRHVDIQDALKTHFLTEAARIEPRIYARAREHGLVDRWISTVEGLQELVLRFDRLHRRDLMAEEPGTFQRVINALIDLKKQLPEELARVRRLGASIPPVRRESRLKTDLRRRLMKALTRKLVHPVLLAKELGIETSALRSLICAVNKPEKIILNVYGKGYFLRDRPPPGRRDLREV